MTERLRNCASLRSLDVCSPSEGSFQSFSSGCANGDVLSPTTSRENLTPKREIHSAPPRSAERCLFTLRKKSLIVNWINHFSHLPETTRQFARNSLSTIFFYKEKQQWMNHYFMFFRINSRYYHFFSFFLKALSLLEQQRKTSIMDTGRNDRGEFGHEQAEND